ncbi:MAG: hypothetical protein EPO68_17910 [Planctomycetota bacterium]|nr:MAG: hypothetical protein EPO68_17910 [Planctomycetota bacterium]
MRARSLAVACALSAALHAALAAQGGANNAALPVSTGAEERLAQGDDALRLRPDSADAFEHWHGALVEFGPAALVERRKEPGAFDALCVAVRKRVLALDTAGRRRWSERFEPLAARSGSDWRALSTALDREPFCASALRAGLRAVDLALAGGEIAAAQSLASDVLAQARVAREFAPQVAQLESAAEHRLAALRAREPAARRSPRGPLELATVAPIGPPGRIANWDPFTLDAGLARGLAAGLACDGEHVVVQTPTATWWAAPDLGALRGFEPRELVRRVRPDLAPDAGALAAPGWTTQPLLSGRRLWMVLGRSLDGFAPNALVCIDLPAEHASAALAPQVPELAWLRSGNEHYDARLAEVRAPSGAAAWPAELETAEFQAPLVRVGELLLARARTLEPTARQWLLALDPDSGALRWSALTAEGAFLLHDDPRLRLIDTDRASRTAGAGPLSAADGRAFDGTHLGLGALVRLSDGAVLGARRHARRAPAASAREELGGSTGALLPTAAPAVLPALWLPADGDRVGAWRSDAGSGALELAESVALVLRSTAPSAHLASAHDGLPVPPRFDAGPRVALLGTSGERVWLLREEDERWRIADVGAAAGASFERRPPRAQVAGCLGWPGGALVADEEALWLFELGTDVRLVQRLEFRELLERQHSRFVQPFQARPMAVASDGRWVWLATPSHWLVFRCAS